MRRVSIAVKSTYETSVGYSYNGAKRLMKQDTIQVQCPFLRSKTS